MSDMSYISKMLSQSDELIEKYGEYPVPKEYYNLRALLMAQAIRNGCHVTIEKEERVATLEKKRVTDLIFEKETDGTPLKKYIHVDVEGLDFKIQDKYLFKVMPEDYDALVLNRAEMTGMDDFDGYEGPDNKNTELEKKQGDDDYDSFFKDDTSAKDENAEPVEESVSQDEGVNIDDTSFDIDTNDFDHEDVPNEESSSKEYEAPDISDRKNLFDDDLSALDNLPDPYTKQQENDIEAPEVEIDDGYLSSLYDEDPVSDAEEPDIPESEPEVDTEDEQSEDVSVSVTDITNRLPVFKKYPNLPSDPENGKLADTFLYNQHRLTITQNGETKEYEFYIYPLKVEKDNLSTDIFVVGVMNHKYIRASISRGKTAAVTIAFNDNFLVRGSWKKGAFQTQIMYMSEKEADVQDELVAYDTRKTKTQYTYMNIPTDTDDEVYLFPGSIKENDDTTGLARAAMVLKTKKDVMVLSPTQEGIFALNNGAVQIECYWIGDRLEYNIL